MSSSSANIMSKTQVENSSTSDQKEESSSRSHLEEDSKNQQVTLYYYPDSRGSPGHVGGTAPITSDEFKQTHSIYLGYGSGKKTLREYMNTNSFSHIPIVMIDPRNIIFKAEAFNLIKLNNKWCLYYYDKNLNFSDINITQNCSDTLDVLQSAKAREACIRHELLIACNPAADYIRAEQKQHGDCVIKIVLPLPPDPGRLAMATNRFLNKDTKKYNIFFNNCANAWLDYLFDAGYIDEKRRDQALKGGFVRPITIARLACEIVLNDVATEIERLSKDLELAKNDDQRKKIEEQLALCKSRERDTKKILDKINHPSKNVDVDAQQDPQIQPDMTQSRCTVKKH